MSAMPGSIRRTEDVMTTDQKLAEETEKALQEYLDWAACYHNGGPSDLNAARREFGFGYRAGLTKGKEIGRASMREEVKEFLSKLDEIVEMEASADKVVWKLWEVVKEFRGKL